MAREKSINHDIRVLVRSKRRDELLDEAKRIVADLKNQSFEVTRMKTLSEYEAQRKSSEDEYWKGKLERAQKWLSELEEKNIPLYEEKDPRTHYEPDQVESMRRGMRQLIQNGRTSGLGVACDHCGTELVDREPGCITLSSPPKLYVGCPGCGWIGWQRA
jgi:hypothetical protein